MSQPTREEIIRAHETLNYLYERLEMGLGIGSISIKDSLSVIKKALLPKPKRTMADLEWDNEEHYLAEAETEDGIKVVMISQHGDFISCTQPRNAVIGLPKEELTPTGRYYTPTQPQGN